MSESVTAHGEPRSVEIPSLEVMRSSPDCHRGRDRGGSPAGSVAVMTNAQLKRLSLHLVAVAAGLATYWLVIVPTLHIAH
jgi:hypothetical protein